MPLQEVLRQLLQAALRDGLADLETLSNGHVCGHVVSSEFDGLDYEQRHARIREVIRQAEQRNTLSRQDVLNIGTLLAYTPAEWSVAITDIK